VLLAAAAAAAAASAVAAATAFAVLFLPVGIGYRSPSRCCETHNNMLQTRVDVTKLFTNTPVGFSYALRC
jgi:hypothetical protein